MQLYDDRRDFRVDGSDLFTLPRGRAQPDGRHVHVVDYHHIIHALRRWPSTNWSSASDDVSSIIVIELAVVEAGSKVLFTRTTYLVQKLPVAQPELGLKAAIGRLDRFDLLILDDLANVTKDQAGPIVALPSSRLQLARPPGTYCRRARQYDFCAG